MNTTLAIPVWDDRVSTTFDFAQKLLVVEVEGEREVSRKEVPLRYRSGARKAQIMRDSGIRVLLCGAISRPLARLVSQAGVHIYPLVAGQVDDVLAAYLCGQLSEPRFLQPGCRPGARRRWRHGEGFYGHNRQWQQTTKEV